MKNPSVPSSLISWSQIVETTDDGEEWKRKKKKQEVAGQGRRVEQKQISHVKGSFSPKMVEIGVKIREGSFFRTGS